MPQKGGQVFTKRRQGCHKKGKVVTKRRPGCHKKEARLPQKGGNVVRKRRQGCHKKGDKVVTNRRQGCQKMEDPPPPGEVPVIKWFSFRFNTAQIGQEGWEQSQKPHKCPETCWFYFGCFFVRSGAKEQESWYNTREAPRLFKKINFEL